MKANNGLVLGGYYCEDSPRFNRGILSGLSRNLKAASHDACIVMVYEDTRQDEADNPKLEP